MSKYYGVDAVEQKGTQVQNYYGNGERPNVSSDEALVVILSNGLYEIAVDVTDSDNFKYFYNLYAQGHYIAFKLYKLDKSILVDCPDQGRRSLL